MNTETTKDTADQINRPRIFYGWWIVITGALTMAVVISPIFQGIGTFFVSFEKHFGWSRTVLSGAFSLSRMEGAILGPLEGLLIDRIGSRRCIIIGLSILAVGFMALSFTKGIIDFYIYFLIVFTGAGIGGFMPIMAAINNWFVRRRTLALAIGMAGVNLGGILVPLLAWLIVTLGWRTSAFLIGLLVLLLTIPLSRIVRNNPESYGLRPDGDSINEDINQKIEQESDEDFTVKEALKTSAFWWITIAHAASAMSSITITVHLIPALTDIGMSLQMAGVVVSTFTFTGFIFQLFSGFIGDKFPKPPLIAFFTSIQGISMLVAATMSSTLGVFVFAVLFGMGFGGRIPVLMAIRGDYFGRKNFATIFGISQFPMNLGMIITPIMAGFFFDNTGSYLIPFAILGMFNFVGAVLILKAKKPSKPLSVST